MVVRLCLLVAFLISTVVRAQSCVGCDAAGCSATGCIGACQAGLEPIYVSQPYFIGCGRVSGAACDVGTSSDPHHNDLCASTHCDYNNGASSTNKCLRDAFNGVLPPCGSNPDCVSGVCATIGSNKQCLPATIGTPCFFGGDCSSAYCANSNYNTRTLGACAVHPLYNLPAGDQEPCGRNTDCTSGVCHGANAQFTGGFCYPAPIGGTCQTTYDCGSQMCSGATCQASTTGGTCFQNGDCGSNVCTSAQCQSSPCRGTCLVDTDCTNGICVNGACQGKPDGAPCAVAADCYSLKCATTCQPGPICSVLNGGCDPLTTCIETCDVHPEGREILGISSDLLVSQIQGSRLCTPCPRGTFGNPYAVCTNHGRHCRCSAHCFPTGALYCDKSGGDGDHDADDNGGEGEERLGFETRGEGCRGRSVGVCRINACNAQRECSIERCEPLGDTYRCRGE